MIIQIDVEPDIADKIAAQAQAQGVTVDDYLRHLLEETAVKEESTTTLTPQEKVRLLHEWTASHSSNTPLLSDEAISRESIYGERG
jgi:hypothetical protein